MTQNNVTVPVTAQLKGCFWRVQDSFSRDSLAKRRNVLLNATGVQARDCAKYARSVKHDEEFEKLQEMQHRLNELRQELARVNLRLGSPDARHASSVDELQAIVDLPQVINAQSVTPETIVFAVRIIVMCRRYLYHIGTWAIFFGNMEEIMFRGRRLEHGHGDGHYFRARRIVETRLHESYPAYDYGDGSFCFGTQLDLIDAHASNGQFLHAMQAMIASMSSFNDNDQFNEVPSTFKQYRP